ncbi:type IV secretion system protein TraC, partial [Escherichia coli]|nr:type IV secretion system protein TraC [Escherichia coli]
SLVTALKLPDESAKANEVLGEMSFPQFSRLLPYRDYNQESGLFMNDTTMGFMLEAIPINGANESIVEALDHMLRTKLPRGIPLCIHLMSSQLVGDRIEYGLREFSWSGEQAERFNAITRAYYMKAAATQFPLPEGMNLPLTLRHYRVFISYCSPSKKKSRADILEMENLVKIIRASLQGASITTQTVDAQAFIDIVGEMINHNPDSLYPKRRQLDPYSDLNYQCVEDSFDLKVRADYLTLGLRENGRNSTARILNFHLARNPEIAFLWNVADNYSNLLNPELSISCPFILTLTLVVEDQVKTHSEANLKYMDLEKKSKTSYAKWFPSVEKEAKEWGELRQRLGSGQSSVVSYFLNITAFCKDNNETALEVEQDILNSFRKNGFELISPRFNHMRNFLTCLPFMAGKGLFKQLKEAGVVQRAESFNVANLMPLVADNPLTPAGLLAPTYRNQLAFIDIFFRGMNNTNYNMAVCGTSGAGKTGLIQPLIRSVLDSGGFAVVFDMGDGYKSLCENMGGVYLDGETLRFNPFANITDIDQSAERVRDQLSVMASPNGNLDEVHEGLLLQAVRASWLAKENRARIDDVVDFLKNASDSEQYAESPTIRSRLDEMIVLLDQYTANGTYGQYFNSDEPSLRDDAKMVVLELGGLEDRPSLLVAVMFSLIIYIENRMYRTPRNLKKLNVIDEGWRLLDFKNHKVGEFIEKGYRTARRHTGAYITITQNIVDFDSDKASSAARAAWGNSSYKIILKQSAKEFAKYNQLYPDQFLPLQRDMIGKFGAAKDQWFSSFLLQVENHSSWHRLFVDPLSRAMYSSDGPDFEFVQQKRKEGLSIHEAVWQLAWKKSGPEMASLEAWLEEHEKYRSVGMSSTQKPADVTAERRRHWWWTVPGCLAMVLLNAAVSYGIVRLNAPVTVAFNMKQTVDAFFDSASQKQLSEAQSKALSARFNTALEASLQAWQQKHHAVILVSPAVVQGAPDITREIQQDIARRMRAEP